MDRLAAWQQSERLQGKAGARVRHRLRSRKPSRTPRPCSRSPQRSRKPRGLDSSLLPA